MPRNELLKQVKKIVVKVGTSTISEDGILSGKKISNLVSDLAALNQRGYQVVLVSSGAISAGAGELQKGREQLTIPEKQAFAAVGQAVLINQYRKYFSRKGFTVGQILLTEDDVKHRRRFLNARHTLNALLDLGVIPIVNENDSVMVKEIKIGDNDTLSAHVASLIDADVLILLSDIDGFYNDLKDPAPVEEISKITNDVLKKAGGSGSIHGTGGMLTKIKAAQIIIRFGEMMVIANGSMPGVLNRIMNGEKIGTIFVGREKPLSSKKKWLALRKGKGYVRIDAGAVAAIRERKKSLLASGIRSIEGHFGMGDIVEIVDEKKNSIGHGIVNYDHTELELIKGKKSTEIKKILGSTYFDEVINRDDLIIY
ncbi:MAG: glutamate 5-kinase [bacterium]|nr:glutamate 5-kinase [bacterium]